MRLVAERLTNEIQESFSSPAMEWGVKYEPMARMAYEIARETFVDTTGFWKHTSIPWVGCSPDGLVGTEGLVEIKCPNTTTHLDYLLAGEIPAEYYKQIQGQLWVMNREWCDFISYDPRMPERKRLFIKRCYRSNDSIADIEEATKVFLSEIINLIIKLEE
jgi:putative phage-type endonuclease